MKTEHVEVESYVEERWFEFRKTTPTDDDIPESVRRAKYMYQFYYSLCSDFNIEQSFCKLKMRHRFTDGHFVPVLPVTSLGSPSKQSVAATASKNLMESMVADFDVMLWGKLVYYNEIRTTYQGAFFRVYQE